MYTLVHVYYQAYKKKGKYLWRYICAVTYMQPKKLAGFFMNLEGEKLICRSAMTCRQRASKLTSMYTFNQRS